MKIFQLIALSGLMAFALFSGCSYGEVSAGECTCDKDSMIVVMRFELKVKPESVAFLKQSFDACKAEVLAKEPGCLDYSLFQSYNDSTLFCINETWASKGDHDAHMQLEHTKKHISETSEIRDPSFEANANYVYWVCPGANDVN
jgi:quinol monooxygenase YgiN